MSVKEQSVISNAEWEVMRVVWTTGWTTSKEVIAVLKNKMDWKPATIKTLLGRLVDKGMLETKPEGNKYLYHGAVNEEECIQEKADDFFSQICDKKAGKTLADLLEQATLSFEDINRLEAVIEQKKKEAVEEVACNCTQGQCKCHM